MEFDKRISICAPINIALVKYWGKEDVERIIPKNNSISLTLDKNQLNSTTHLRVSTNLKENVIFLNNKQVKLTSRIISVLKEALIKSSIPAIYHDSVKIEIKSYNNFPTGAGLASSASGMAALAFGLGQIFNLSMLDVSVLARLGSGSATRSVFGGIVEWLKDTPNLESHSIQHYPESYWPELRVLICIVSGAEKKVASTAGMQSSVRTSQLIRYRFESAVHENLTQLRTALARRDFPSLATVVMRESNQLHAVCLDSTPPILYLNAASLAIIEFVTVANELLGEIRFAYTFDAGPNAFLLFEAESTPLLGRLLTHCFGGSQFQDVFNIESITTDETGCLLEKLPKYEPGLVESVILTNVGSGPSVVTGDGDFEK